MKADAHKTIVTAAAASGSSRTSVRSGAASMPTVMTVMFRRRRRKHKQRFLHNHSAQLYGWTMLDVHRLRVFRSVVASGSINAAAANLGCTPSAVSQQVSALQRETGLALLTRIGRGIEPTAAGLALAAEIDALLHRLGDVESFVADLRAGRRGTLA